jgi:hypothetical protein
MWNQLAIFWNVSRLLKSCETLELSLQGKPKRAHDKLVKLGAKALPTLRSRNRRLIAEHRAYSDWLKSGPSTNPFQNFGLKSDTEKHHRYVIEMKQARVADVIEDIERSAGSR